MRVELELEVVTPLIMSGADQKEFELREMSINGAMRYWYRKLYDVERETEVFGNNVKKGKFTLRVLNESLGEKNVDKDIKVKTRTRSGSLIVDMNYGRNYFLGLLRPSRRNNNLDRSAAVHGSFALSIDCMKCSGIEWKQLLGSLWASIYIGGWGTRSRRGFGSLKVVSGEDVFIPRNFRDFYKEAFEEFRFKDRSLEVYVVENFDRNNFIREVRNRTNSHEGRYKRPSERLKVLKIPSSDPMDCLDLLGSVMQYFRAYLLPDYEIAKSAVRKKKKLYAEEIWRSDFGTPIMFRFRETGPTSIHNRIPSRLFLRVLKMSEGCYPVLIFDKSRPRVSDKDRDKPNDLIRVFLDVLLSSGAKKVIP